MLCIYDLFKCVVNDRVEHPVVASGHSDIESIAFVTVSFTAGEIIWDHIGDNAIIKIGVDHDAPLTGIHKHDIDTHLCLHELDIHYTTLKATVYNTMCMLRYSCI